MSANSSPSFRLNRDPIFWRLVYADGREMDEPISGGSIREAWKHPQDLIIVKWDGSSIVRVPVPKGACPIFYRRRSAAITSKPGEPSRLDGTVFGWAREVGGRIVSRLWAVIGNSAPVDCPSELLSQAAIESIMIDYFNI